MVEDDFVELAAAIGAVREQLRWAQEWGRGQVPRFAVGKVEIELAVEARREGGIEGGVEFGVSLKAKGGGSSASTHRLRLELLPIAEDGKSFEVRGTVAAPPAR